MRLYRVTWIDDDPQDDLPPHRCEYVGTEAAVKAAEKRLKAEYMRNIRSTPVEVPTDKQGLMAFLNQSHRSF